MKRLLGLALVGLCSTPLAALAQDSLPPGDITIFSTFHARLAAYEDVSRWAAERQPGRGERGWANRVANSGRDGREWVVKFLGKYGAQVHPVEGDSLTLAATLIRGELEALQGRALDSAWARHMTLWLDEARVRAIFVESKQLQHRKARGAESSLRGAWGNGYLYACHVRSRYERKGLDGRDLACGQGPDQPPEASAPRAAAR